MNGNRGFSPMTQQYLDGEPVHVLEAGEREAADRLAEAAAAYAASLVAPGPELDAAVRRALAGRRPAPGRLAWRRLNAPVTVRLRPVWVAAAAAALVVLWWGTRTAERLAPLPSAQAARSADTVYVRFDILAPTAQAVAVTGSFSQWSPDGVALSRSEQAGLWTVTLALPVGEHQYLFIVDGELEADPRAHAQVDDGFGGRNSVIVVGPKGVVRS